jgi:hypothetical protein
MSRATLWILGGIFFLVVGICIAGAWLALTADSTDVDVNLGTDEFEINDIDGLAARIADDAPEAYGDPTNGNRPIIINHLGDDVETGWIVILAISPDSDSCAINWDDDDQVFRDCEGETYPPDGEGLDQFPTRVEDDTLFVDLGRGRPDEQAPDAPDDSIVITGDD